MIDYVFEPASESDGTNPIEREGFPESALLDCIAGDLEEEEE